MSLKDLFKKDKSQDKVKESKAKAAVSSSPAAKPAGETAVSQDKSKAAVKGSSKSKPVKPAKPAEGAKISHRVLIKPLLTEKGAGQVAEGKYLFMVDRQANKISIAQAIEETYGVKVKKVNVINYSGKKVSYGRRQGQRKRWKKAVVTLPPGQTIEVYKGV